MENEGYSLAFTRDAEHAMDAWLTYVAPLAPTAFARPGIKGIHAPKRSAQLFQTAGLHVDCSPQYMFDPLAPYRINMVRPGAKFLVVLRDPTDRYLLRTSISICFGQRLLIVCARFRACCPFQASASRRSTMFREGEEGAQWVNYPRMQEAHVVMNDTRWVCGERTRVLVLGCWSIETPYYLGLGG